MLGVRSNFIFSAHPRPSATEQSVVVALASLGCAGRHSQPGGEKFSCNPLRWTTPEEIRCRRRGGIRRHSAFASVHCSSATNAATANKDLPGRTTIVVGASRGLRNFTHWPQSTTAPQVKLATAAVIAPARSEARNAAVSATSARVGRRLSIVVCAAPPSHCDTDTPAASAFGPNRSPV